MAFEKEILAYSLQNAIEHGKADAGRVLPKLFQHGLEKYQVKEIMPEIQKIVKKVNEMSKEEMEKSFVEFSEIVKKREEEKKELPELPSSKGRRKFVFRAAPFPSGALHIGNAKTYLLNALYAQKYSGDLLLVMDDTIGSAEKPPIKEGYDLIKESFSLLGVDYKKPIIYKSDRLKIYYEHAEKLIKKNKAYVCHCPQETLRENRLNQIECSCRQYPPEVQIKRWKEMFDKKEGEATLRIKTSMQDANPAFRDRVLFKISDREHPRVDKKYRVWPTLEMSWAIDDHLLGITHIIRGNDLTIETEMEKYIWDIFGWKHCEIIHTGLIRLEGVGAKVSKSKAQKEVLSGEFIGWDDPRTWSIQSLIKRGIKKEAITEFVKEIGLNRQDIIVPIETLYSINRKMMDADAKRYSFVQNPVEIKIADFPQISEVEVPVHPDKTETKKVKINGKIFVSEKDFKNYILKEIRLLHLFNIILNQETKITSTENKKIPKINWVSENIPVRILMPEGDWIEGIAESNVENINLNELIQFERVGFCNCVSKDRNAYEFWFAHS